VCAVDPLLGECLLGAMFQGLERGFWQRGTELGQPPPWVPCFALLADLLVDLLYVLGR